LHNCLNITSQPIRNLLLRLAQELEFPGLATMDLVETMGQSLQIELARYILNIPSHLDCSRGGLTRGAYRRVFERIEADASPPSLAELAVLAGLSERHMTRAFRESTGISVSEMIDEARYKRAVNLLKRTSLKIAPWQSNLASVQLRHSPAPSDAGAGSRHSNSALP